ncbi:unnamed protein product [Heligmosomoides polygyrus]|uniref:Beta-lactamase domain-containing protein n=1 Tax=Heligmosomoides polygyrus TaxID=6339 RepID=A0A3P7YLS2_HELPZ|nr:unnamed protein product [Heligmosomoides polygyrus]
MNRASHDLNSAADRLGPLQIVHPPPPDEKGWVLTCGNESLVDNVLSISLKFGARLVSMGYFQRQRQVNYYAIMHKYTGPVFIKPSPMTYDELMVAVEENKKRDLVITQICGQEEKPGRVTFTTYWERIPGVEFEIWFPGTDDANAQRVKFERDGLRLAYLCGYTEGSRGRYVGVWQTRRSSPVQYEAHYGLTLDSCMLRNKLLTAKGFIATLFGVFNNGHQKMYSKLQSNSKILPRHVSHFVDKLGSVQYVVLWSDFHSNRYPDVEPLWRERDIPVRFLKGSPELLSESQLDFLIQRVEHFMRDLDIPGLSIAIAKREQLKFAAGFGYADLHAEEVVTPNHQFRVGSVSKPITACAIMLLIDQGKLKIDGKLFGKGSIFGDKFAKRKSYKKYVTDVTVRNLLEHSAGGWDNLQSDAAWIQPQMSTEELITYVLDNVPLEHKPGTKWIYSNFGYQVLGYLTEHFSGTDYESFVKKSIFAPAGVHDIQVARPSISEKATREVLYYMSGNSLGFDPYEMLSPKRIGPWGGWIASPIQLLLFMSRVDGFPHRRDLLSQKSISMYSTPSTASNSTYGLGWSLNIMGFNGWQHDGRMPGSAAMLEYSERDFFHELGYVLHHVGNNHDWWNDDSDLFRHLHD